MTDSNYGQPLDSRKRVLAFIAEWQRRAEVPGAGPDPEVIYGLGMHDGMLELRVSDLLELSEVIEGANEASMMEWGTTIEDDHRNRLS